MFATLTSKGQVTLPKELRDRLGLDAGSILDFQPTADDTFTVRCVRPNAMSLRGLLKSPHPSALTPEQEDEGIARYVTQKHGAPRASAASKRR